MIEKKFGVLILGATCGSLFATKLSLAGHDVQLMCLPNEAKLINAEGTRVRLLCLTSAPAGQNGLIA